MVSLMSCFQNNMDNIKEEMMKPSCLYCLDRNNSQLLEDISILKETIEKLKSWLLDIPGDMDGDNENSEEFVKLTKLWLRNLPKEWQTAKYVGVSNINTWVDPGDLIKQEQEQDTPIVDCTRELMEVEVKEETSATAGYCTGEEDPLDVNLEGKNVDDYSKTRGGREISEINKGTVTRLKNKNQKCYMGGCSSPNNVAYHNFPREPQLAGCI